MKIKEARSQIEIVKNDAEGIELYILMNDYIRNVYYKQTKQIGLLEIEKMIIDFNYIYIINDLTEYKEYPQYFINIKKRICEDEARFTKFIKNLSLISSYYSLCNIKKNLPIEVQSFIDTVNCKKKKKKLQMYIEE